MGWAIPDRRPCGAVLSHGKVGGRDRVHEARPYASEVSVNVFVFLGGHLPSPSEWQAELDRLGINLRLDEGINPSTHSGYWPALVDGEPSGFEFYSGGVTDVFGTPAPTGIGDRDV